MANDILMSLLNPEQRSQAQEDAFRQGLLGLSQGLIASAIPRGGRKTSTLEALALAAPGAIQSYRGSFDQTLKDLLTGMQVKDLIAKKREQDQLKALLPQVFKTTRTPGTEIPTELGATGDLGTYAPIMEPGRITGVQLDPQKIQALMMIPGGIEAAKGIADTQKLIRQAGLGVGGQMMSPLDVFSQAQNPRVRDLAANYKKSYDSGLLDDNRLNQVVGELGRMEDNYVTRTMASEERQSARAEAREEKAAERAIPKPDEQKQITGADNTISAIKAFKDRLSSFGRTDILNPTQRSEIQTLYRNMLLQAKEAYNLGVLNGPDLMIMEQIVQDPTSMAGLAIGSKAIGRQADELDRIMNTIKSNVKSNVSARAGSSMTSFDELRRAAQQELAGRKSKGQ